ncbi:hypothetical protein H312_01533, partial [Anncaliia algerae PRA339]
MNLESTEEIIIKMNEKQILDYAMRLGIFKKEMSCSEFCKSMKLQKASRYVDGYAWRCTNKMCIKYQKRKSVRTYSKFEKMNTSLKTILKVIIKYCCGLSRKSILKSVELSKPCLSKILSILINEMIIDNQNLKK